MCLWGAGCKRKERFNSSGHLKERSGFLVALFGFCGFVLGLQHHGGLRLKKKKEIVKMKRVKKKLTSRKECGRQRKVYSTLSVSVWVCVTWERKWRFSTESKISSDLPLCDKKRREKNATKAWDMGNLGRARPCLWGWNSSTGDNQSQSKAAADLCRSQEGWVA